MGLRRLRGCTRDYLYREQAVQEQTMMFPPLLRKDGAPVK
jgi:hypothetical protein